MISLLTKAGGLPQQVQTLKEKRKKILHKSHVVLSIAMKQLKKTHTHTHTK